MTKEQLLNAFSISSTEHQLRYILMYIREEYEKEDTNKTEFIINLRNYLLDY